MPNDRIKATSGWWWVISNAIRQISSHHDEINSIKEEEEVGEALRWVHIFLFRAGCCLIAIQHDFLLHVLTWA